MVEDDILPTSITLRPKDVQAIAAGFCQPIPMLWRLWHTLWLEQHPPRGHQISQCCHHLAKDHRTVIYMPLSSQ